MVFLIYPRLNICQITLSQRRAAAFVGAQYEKTKSALSTAEIFVFSNTHDATNPRCTSLQISQMSI
jgi:hypothetical protein